MAVANESVLTLLECPVCLENISPPVKQCVKGHLVCQECFPRLHHCPTCRGQMSHERNLAMEQVAHLLRYPCRYSLGGCPALIPLSEKSSHEKNCSFLHLKCPFHGQCTFSGPLADIRPHLKSEHNVIPVKVRDDGRLFYRARAFPRRLLWTLLFEWQSTLFKLSIKRVSSWHIGRTDDVYFLVVGVQSVGAEGIAENFRCHIALFDFKRRRNAFRPRQLHVTCATKDLESLCAGANASAPRTAATTANASTSTSVGSNTVVTMRTNTTSTSTNTGSTATVTRGVNTGNSASVGVQTAVSSRSVANKDSKCHVLLLSACQAKHHVDQLGNLGFVVEMSGSHKHNEQKQ